MHLDRRPHDDGSRNPSIDLRLQSTERLRRLAELWPSFDDDERATLETHLHRLQASASA